MKYKAVPQYIAEARFFLDVPDERLKRVSYVYLHGELEDMAVERGGYDIFSFMDGAPKKDGMYPCDVYMSEDEIIESTLFFWKDGSCMGQHGLIVKNDDTESFEYAKSKYSKRATII